MALGDIETKLASVHIARSIIVRHDNDTADAIELRVRFNKIYRGRHPIEFRL